MNMTMKNDYLGNDDLSENDYTLHDSQPPQNGGKHELKSEYFEKGCKPADERPCRDMQSGEHEFEGPAVVYAINANGKSHAVVKKEDDDNHVIFHAVWPTGRVIIDCEGTFAVKYKWNACSECEPTFAHSEYPCPCK